MGHCLKSAGMPENYLGKEDSNVGAEDVLTAVVIALGHIHKKLGIQDFQKVADEIHF